MYPQTILLVTDMNTEDTVIANAATAAFNSASHLSCAILEPAPTLPINAYGGLPYVGSVGAENWPDHIAQVQTKMQIRVDQIKAIVARAGVSGDVHALICATADIKHAIARRAATCDIACIAPNLRDVEDLFHPAVQGILFHSPIGVVLNAPVLRDPKRVFLAWDGGLAAARAAHMALSQLQVASEVTVGCIDLPSGGRHCGEDPGVDVAIWLSHHGCNVTVNQYPSGGQEIGACIQQRADEIGADLVVMGGYGHSRLLETVFGGTTKTVLEQTDFPVFMAH